MPVFQKPRKNKAPRAKHLNTVLVSKVVASGKHKDKRKQVKHKNREEDECK